MEVLEELVVRQRQDIDRLQAELAGVSETNGSEIVNKNKQLEELSKLAEEVWVGSCAPDTNSFLLATPPPLSPQPFACTPPATSVLLTTLLRIASSTRGRKAEDDRRSTAPAERS